MTFLLIRPSDHLLLGITWTGMSVLTGGPGGQAQLKADSGGARITITLPPQHVSEETSDPGSAAPLQLPVSGTTVPAWRAALAGTSQLVISIANGTVIPLTVEGILAAIAERPVITTTGSGPATALELPSRLTITPAASTAVVCRH